jgi:tetratricopeptide (TPR) repeat protein
MKKVFMVIVLLLCAAISPVVAQTAQEQAVLNVARLETETFLKLDSVKWKTFFIHNDKTSRVYSGRSWYNSTQGWPTLSKLMIQWMREQGKDNNYNKVTVSKPTFNISSNLATVIYDQSLTSDKTDTLPALNTKEFRTLLKQNEEWKIVSIASYDTASYSSVRPQAVEDEINALGYRFLFAKNIEKAIEVFKFNVQMYPNAWNPYDSLGEGYAAAGNKKLAILNYEKSVQLNPKNENGKKILAQLKSAGSTGVAAADKIQ